jgi:hypothetical protein
VYIHTCNRLASAVNVECGLSIELSLVAKVCFFPQPGAMAKECMCVCACIYVYMLQEPCTYIHVVGLLLLSAWRHGQGMCMCVCMYVYKCTYIQVVGLLQP